MAADLARTLERRVPAPLAASALVAALLLGSVGVARAEDDKSEEGPAGTTSPCIDKEIADRLSVKRQRRGVVDRLYVKQNRHEFTARGGYFVSDLYSATYIAGAAYSYHMTEQTAVELSFAYTHQDADTIRAIEGGRGTVLEDEYARTLFAESILLWSPVYGKFRLGGSVMRFDMHFDVGVGIVDSQTSRGASGIGGIGLKVFLGQPVALRIDFRDRVYQQELLAESFIVNDLSVTAGLSLFLPLRN